ncbi:RteC domain-containing protein [Lacinutrix algicola]|uniref:RteC domain-containing protein n=1 Tax=Lacinutrix algicola TaxID=342954 RepID=UPI0006E12834|nr:RteC domain-containing protein [Lacinutrix algicola]
MDFELQNKKLLDDLYSIKHNTKTIIERSNQTILSCRNLLHSFKKEIVKNGFKSVNDEIIFFKVVKQIPLIHLIYFSEVRSFEIQFPKGDTQLQQKHIKKKLGKLNRFFLYNIDFGQYIQSNQIHLDQQYFTRDYFDNLPITSSKFYFQDPDFCTPYDMLLGKLKANYQLIDYLQNRLVTTKQINGNSINTTDQVELQWTSSKTALTELIYALYHGRAINNGKTDIKVIASTLEKVLHFDVGDFYKTFSDIKSRKISRTKFLDDLSTGLLSHMNNSEE